jgi:hypothetical protein
MINQQLPHRARSNPVEMLLIIPLVLRRLQQPQTHLVHKCRRLQRVLGLLVGKQVARNAAKLVVGNIKQFRRRV